MGLSCPAPSPRTNDSCKVEEEVLNIEDKCKLRSNVSAKNSNVVDEPNCKNSEVTHKNYSNTTYTGHIETDKNITVLYTNVRSLVSNSKRDELKILIEKNNVDIVGITETWGRSDILDGEMDLPGFKLYRKDRSAIKDNKKLS